MVRRRGLKQIAAEGRPLGDRAEEGFGVGDVFEQVDADEEVRGFDGRRVHCTHKRNRRGDTHRPRLLIDIGLDPA